MVDVCESTELQCLRFFIISKRKNKDNKKTMELGDEMIQSRCLKTDRASGINYKSYTVKK